jgi:hypothetical protein
MTEFTMTELEELESIYCELYKDVYGIKARWYRAESIEQARADLDRLQAEGERVWEAERQQEAANSVRFEQRIADTIKMGAGTRADALRWIHEAEGSDGDDEYLCHLVGLPYGYFRKV